MKTIEVIMVRVYLTEAEVHLKSLIKRLNDWGKVRGVTVFKGIAGFGVSGKIHSSTLLDNADDSALPVIIEFFDEPAKVTALLEYLNNLIEPGHIISWPATLIVG